MKAGFFVGLDRSGKVSDRVIAPKEFLELSEYMTKYNIMDSQDIHGPYETHIHAEKFKDSFVKAMLILVHGSDDPKICGAARNTSLFEPHGPIVGEFGYKIPARISLRETIARLSSKRPGYLYEVPKSERRTQKMTFSDKKDYEMYKELWKSDLVSENPETGELVFYA
jgi:hypothetical protein